MICGGQYQFRFAAKGHVLCWCEKCNFGRLSGDFTPENVKSFYHADYYTHNIDGNSTQLKAGLADRLRDHIAWRCDYGMDFKVEELGVASGRTICDIGCGNGSMALMLEKAGFQVAGVEPDSIARRLCRPTDMHEGTAENLPPVIAERRFDVVCLFHVLEHCIDPNVAVANARSILSENGLVVIEVPNNAALGFGPEWPWTDIPRHLSFFTETSLIKLLSKHELKVFNVYYRGYYRQIALTRSWRLLARTACASRSGKYDSIRVHARLLH